METIWEAQRQGHVTGARNKRNFYVDGVCRTGMDATLIFSRYIIRLVFAATAAGLLVNSCKIVDIFPHLVKRIKPGVLKPPL